MITKSLLVIDRTELQSALLICSYTNMQGKYLTKYQPKIDIWFSIEIFNKEECIQKVFFLDSPFYIGKS